MKTDEDLNKKMKINYFQFNREILTSSLHSKQNLFNFTMIFQIVIICIRLRLITGNTK